MIAIENQSNQSAHFVANLGERKRLSDGEFAWDLSIPVKFSRVTAVEYYEAEVARWNAATPKERENLTAPATLVDPYTQAPPVARVVLDDAIKALGPSAKDVKPADVLAALRRDPYFRHLEHEKRIVVTGG